MELKNLAKAAQRIQKAIKRKESIVLYGDADLDGVTSVIILKETILNLGGRVKAVYFPDREKEGYGITLTALSKLKRFSPALLIAMDLGITNFTEIQKAKSLGFDVILIDHHQVIKKLPPADIVVDPHQRGERYPFKGFAACGLTFKLSENLLENRVSPSLRKGLGELAALGTIADMMPQEADNRNIVEEGLSGIGETWRPGLKVFLESQEFLRRTGLLSKIGYLISVLNVRDIQKGLPAAFRLLTISNGTEARELLEFLEKKHKVRHEEIERIVQSVLRRQEMAAAPSLIFDGDASFDYVLLGAAASVLANKYRKPVFLYKKKGVECLGSARAPSGFDTVRAMEHCSPLLTVFGGHPPASGFRVRTKNIKKFETCLAEYFVKHKP